MLKGIVWRGARGEGGAACTLEAARKRVGRMVVRCMVIVLRGDVMEVVRMMLMASDELGRGRRLPFMPPEMDLEWR
jgi:hypothetical protein